MQWDVEKGCGEDLAWVHNRHSYQWRTVDEVQEGFRMMGVRSGRLVSLLFLLYVRRARTFVPILRITIGGLVEGPARYLTSARA